MKPSLLASAILANTAVLLGAGTASAQPAAKPAAASARACGVTAIPLSVGSEWVYQPATPPQDRVLTEAQKRLTPLEPKKLVIKVAGVDTKDGVTTVSLTEDHDGRVHQTWVKCAGGGATFQIAPDAFWFAGEPGTTYGIELSNVERKGQTLGLVGGKIAALEWHDDLIASWKHVVTGKRELPLRSGKLEVIRHWVVQPDEEIGMNGGRLKAKKLGIEITMKVSIEPAPPEPIRPPPLMVNFFWYVDGVGPVQIVNSYGQMYVLTSSTAMASATK